MPTVGFDYAENNDGSGGEEAPNLRREPFSQRLREVGYETFSMSGNGISVSTTSDAGLTLRQPPTRHFANTHSGADSTDCLTARSFTIQRGPSLSARSITRT